MPRPTQAAGDAIVLVLTIREKARFEITLRCACMSVVIACGRDNVLLIHYI